MYWFDAVRVKLVAVAHRSMTVVDWKNVKSSMTYFLKVLRWISYTLNLKIN